MADKSLQALTFGFDIGIASVGWAVLAENRIVDLGVRAFDKAETADKGESLNLQRRTARLMRRRLYRRAWRLTKLARLLKRGGLIADAGFFKAQPSFKDSTWALRVAGLDRLLTAEEWARVLYHLCKHRGFHWFSKAEEVKAEGDTKGEGGKVKKGLSQTAALMKDKGYRSAAEMVLVEFPEAQRNKQGSYDKALSRVLLDEELGKLFEAQRRFGNKHASKELETAIRGTGDRRSGLFWEQHPMQSVLSMLGKCTFEPGEYRAPKASFTAERHVWLTRLNNLRVIVNGESRPLNETEHKFALLLPYQAGEKYTYKNLRNALVKAGLLPDDFRFGSLSYPSAQQKEETKAKDPEEQILIKLPAWHELRLHLKKKELESEWKQMSVAALEGQPEQLDSIGWVLSAFKDDDEVRSELNKLNLPGDQRMVNALLELSFDKFHALSLKALRKIVPLMETGLRYDEAVTQIPEYGHHSQRFVVGKGEHKYLPPFYEGQRTERGSMKFREGLEVPRNPVVLRALNQARKVCNALIREYGSPAAVHIEMARDLSRPLDERRDIEKLQKEYGERNQKSREKFEECFHRKPKGAEFEKWQLYHEQHCKCAYSLEALDLNRVINDPSYVQIDHALPYSRSYDDSKNNKVLVLTRENQNKGNRTAYEYLTSFAGGEEGERWRNYKAWVEGNKSYRQAKRNRLLRKNYGTEEAQGFKDRNLNDTRYICKFFKNYVEQHLQLASNSTAQRCVVLNGQLTSFLRARWGLVKERGDSDRHHAMDAAVIAACGHNMVQRLAGYSRRKELELAGNVIDMETGEVRDPSLLAKLEKDFPKPWACFRQELISRLCAQEIADPTTQKRKLLFHNDINQLRKEIDALGTYPPEAIQRLRTLFVSRAPQRRNGGALHEATLRSPKLISKGESHTRVDIRKLKLSHLERIVGADDPRNRDLIDALRSRLQAHGDDGKKAFATPLLKPSAEGKKAPPIRTVKLRTTQNTGAFIGAAIADLGNMLHVDVFQKDRRHILVPAYGIPDSKRVKPIAAPEDAVFLFSLSKNDLLEVTLGTETTRGYFVMYESDGRLTMRAHDQPQPDKNYFRKSVSNASKLLKLNVDVLGRIYPAPKETRRGLA